MPMDFIFRIICCGDSSNAKYRQRSFRKQAAFAKVAQSFFQPVHPFSGISPQAVVDKSAKIHESATIFPFVFPSSTVTRVSNLSERFSPISFKRGAVVDFARLVEFLTFAPPEATISSTSRTDKPSATMRAASFSI